MQADQELVKILKALRRKWLSESTTDWEHANALYHECSTSETGGLHRGKQVTFENCARDIASLIEKLD